MCASYGLDPRFDDREFRDAIDAAVLEGLRSWAVEHDGEILRPTGKNLRNLNPLITSPTTRELGWWGYRLFAVEGVAGVHAAVAG